MMARRLISVILTTILVLPSFYLPTFSTISSAHLRASPDPFGWGTNKVSFISVCTSGCTGTWPHVYTITHYDQTSGAFSGTGVGLNDSATEVIRGTITPSGNLTLHSVYTKWSYSYDVTATRADNGTFSGTLISSQNQRSTVTLSPPKESTGNGATPIPQPSPSASEVIPASSPSCGLIKDCYFQSPYGTIWHDRTSASWHCTAPCVDSTGKYARVVPAKGGDAVAIGQDFSFAQYSAYTFTFLYRKDPATTASGEPRPVVLFTDGYNYGDGVGSNYCLSPSNSTTDPTSGWQRCTLTNILPATATRFYIAASNERGGNAVPFDVALPCMVIYPKQDWTNLCPRDSSFLPHVSLPTKRSDCDLIKDCGFSQGNIDHNPYWKPAGSPSGCPPERCIIDGSNHVLIFQPLPSAADHRVDQVFPTGLSAVHGVYTSVWVYSDGHCWAYMLYTAGPFVLDRPSEREGCGSMGRMWQRISGSTSGSQVYRGFIFAAARSGHVYVAYPCAGSGTTALTSCPAPLGCSVSATSCLFFPPSPPNSGTGVGPILPSPRVPVGHCPQKETIDGWSFAWVSCPHDGKVTNVTVRPPRRLPIGIPSPILHDLGLDPHTRKLTLPVRLDLPGATIAVGGFALTLSELSLDSSKLTIGRASTSLPSNIAGTSCAPIDFTDVWAYADGTVYSALAYPSVPVRFSLLGADVSIDGFRLSDQGLAAYGVKLRLPRILDAGAELDVNPLIVDSRGRVTGTIVAFKANVAGLSVDAAGATLSSRGISIDSLHATIPGLNANFNIQHFFWDGKMPTGNAHVTFDPFKVGGSKWSLVGLQGDLHFAGPRQYDITAQGYIALPEKGGALGAAQGSAANAARPNVLRNGQAGMGGRMWSFGRGTNDLAHRAGVPRALAASCPEVDAPDSGIGIAACVHIGSITDEHPSTFYDASIDIKPGIEIVIPDTPFAISGIGGSIETSRGRSGVIYTFALNADVETWPDHGFVFSGKIGGTVATDGNIGVSASGHLLQALGGVKGGFCIRLVDETDTVCAPILASNSSDRTECAGLSRHEVAPSDLGIIASLEAFGSVTRDQATASLRAAVTGHLWLGPATPPPASTVPIANPVPTPTPKVTPPSKSPSPTPTSTATPGSGMTSDVHLALTGHIRAHMDQGFLAKVAGISLAPPCPLDVSVDSYLGTFIYTDPDSRATSYRTGIKADFAGHMRNCFDNPDIAFRKAIFIGTRRAALDFQLADQLDSYQLVQRNSDVPASHPLGASLAGERQGRIGHTDAGPRPPGRAVTRVEHDVRVAPGETDTFFVLSWRRGAPRLRLIAPDGRVYSPPRAGSGVVANAAIGAYWFQSSDPRVLAPGAHAAAALYVLRPQPGLWRVRISNLHGAREGIRLISIGSAPPATLAVTSPGRGRALVARPSAPRVMLAGTLRGGSRRATVSLFYATRPSLLFGRRRSPNYGGRVIVERVPVHAGRWSFAWDTSAVALAPGRYYVYVLLDDGIGPIVYGISAGTIAVGAPARPAPPRAVRGVVVKNQVQLSWLPPAHAADVAGYNLRWRTSDMPRGRWNLLDLGNVHRFALARVIQGAAYAAEISSYNLMGRESRAILARITQHPSRRPTRSARNQHPGHRPTRSARKRTLPPAHRRRPHARPVTTWIGAHPLSPAVDRTATGSGVGASAAYSAVPPLRTMAHARAVATTPLSAAACAGRLFDGMAWPLPGEGNPNNPVVEVGPGDFFNDGVGLQRKGYQAYSRPDAQTDRRHGYLAVVDDPASNATRAFRSTVFFGKLDYVPAVNAGVDVSRIDQRYCEFENGQCVRVGRATGIIGLLMPRSLRTVPRGFNRATDPDKDYRDIVVNPPGWGTGQPSDRGHLLGYVLGGPGNDPRNFVAEWTIANTPVQRLREEEVRDALSPEAAPPERFVFYRVVPKYEGDCVIPYEVRLQAVGQYGFVFKSERGTVRDWSMLDPGTSADPPTVIIRNVDRQGGRWEVPGQERGAQCVPHGYILPGLNGQAVP